MKKIFAFAIALVSMAAVMTSCNNDDADYIMQPAPSAPAPQPNEDIEEFDGNVYFVASTSQLEIFNNTYTVKVGAESFEVNLEDLQEATIQPTVQRTANIINSYRAEYGTQSLKIFRYQIPMAVKNVNEITANPNFEVKSGAQVSEEFDMFAGIIDKDGNGAIKNSIGIDATQTNDYLSIVNNQSFRINY